MTERDVVPVNVRLPGRLHEGLKRSAEVNGRSLQKEILHRLSIGDAVVGTKSLYAPEFRSGSFKGPDPRPSK